MKKSAEGLAQFAEKIFAEKWPYRYGSYGNIIAGKRRSDCYGIRKAYSWDRGTYSVFTAAEDQNAATAFERATIKGNISTMPDRRGIIVCKRNAFGRIYHAGIYVGNGTVIDIYLEGKPARKQPVTSNGWTLWFEDIFIDYSGQTTAVLPAASAPAVSCPYAEPTEIYTRVSRFSGNDARWFQWQLNRIGYKLKIDGDAGTKTKASIWYEIGKGHETGKITSNVCGKQIRDYLKSCKSK